MGLLVCVCMMGESGITLDLVLFLILVIGDQSISIRCHIFGLQDFLRHCWYR